MPDQLPDPGFPPTVSPASGTDPAPTRTYLPSPASDPAGSDLAETQKDTRPLHQQAASVPTVPGYQILGELGRGGMGVVYKARHLALKRLVALKMVLAGDYAGAAERARFKAEAEAVARLQHPNIVQIFDVGDAGGHPFCALEFLDGGSLAQRLAGAPLPPRQAAELVQALARAMHRAHQSGIVHRDLKPANVLLAADGTPKVSDFGLARRLDADSGQTHAGQVMGTPSYMAPEQASGLAHEAGPPADVWALGAILYECLTGKPPFKGASVADTLEQVRSRDPLAPRRLNPAIPRDLETVCLKCLRKEAPARYATAGDLADDLHRFLNFEPVRARRAGALERTLKWMRRRPAVVLAGLVAALLVVGVPVGYRLWQVAEARRREKEDLEAQERERTALRVEYRSALVQRWAVPEGAGRLLSPEQSRRRSVTYRVTRRGPLVEQVDILNGHGVPTLFHPYSAILQPGGDNGARRECSFRFGRDNGSLVSEEALDRRGQVLWSFHHAPPPPSPDNPTGLGWYLDHLKQVQRRSSAGASHVRYTWSRDGLAREFRYLDVTGAPRPDDNGAYGLRLEQDRGQVTRVTYLGPDGKPAANRDGVVSLRRTYDRGGNNTEMTCFDLHDKPTRNRDGVHKFVASFDEDGNQTGLALFDDAGAAVAGPAGFHRVRLRCNDHGDLIESRLFGVHGEPVAVAGIHRTTMEYDARGNRTGEAYFDRHGRRAADARGVARRASAYNDHGEVTTEAYFGPDDQPMLLREGYHRFRAVYDSQGRQAEIAYFGLRDEPIRLPLKNEPGRSLLALDADQPSPPEAGGYHKLKRGYDKFGRETELAYFDIGGRPMTVPAGFHRELRNYDDGVEVSFFDTAGRKALHRDGYHRWKTQTVQMGKASMRVRFYLGLDGARTTTRFGVAGEVRGYDSQKRELELAFLTTRGIASDASGKLVLAVHWDGYSKATAAFDDKGRIIREDYFGPDQRRVVTRRGFARITRTFAAATGKLEAETWWVLDNKGEYVRTQLQRDAHGRLVERALFDAAGKAVLHPDGYHREKFAYDTAGRPVETVYFDSAGQPVNTKLGFHRYATRFEPGLRESAFFDVAGKPVLHPDGYHRVLERFDAAGRRTEMAWFDCDGQSAAQFGVARAVWRYDSRGYETEWANYDGGGRLVVRSGFARRVIVPDERGRWLEVAFFGNGGRPMLYRGGYHLRRVKYDASGRPVEVSFFGTDGKPVVNEFGCHKAVSRYGPAPGRVEVSFFGTDGRPAAQPATGRARLVHQGWPVPPQGWPVSWGEQESREETEFWGLDAAGKYLPGRRGWDNGGVEVIDAYFDSSGRPAGHQHGYHKIVARLEGRRLPVERAYFGSDGQPAVHPNGYHRMTFRYTSRGLESERACWDVNGKPCQHRAGYHRLTRTTLFDVQGRPKLTAEGYHMAELLFDSQGRRIEYACFGTDGWPMLSRKTGAHRLRTRYDSAGRPVAWAYFGTDGQPVVGAEGFARVRHTFDAAGHWTDMALFDAADKQLAVQTFLGPVTPANRAAQLGLKAGDVLVSYGGAAVVNPARFLEARRTEPADGPPRELKVLRGGRTLRFDLPPGKLGVVVRYRAEPRTK